MKGVEGRKRTSRTDKLEHSDLATQEQQKEKVAIAANDRLHAAVAADQVSPMSGKISAFAKKKGAIFRGRFFFSEIVIPGVSLHGSLSTKITSFRLHASPANTESEASGRRGFESKPPAVLHIRHITVTCNHCR